MADKTPKPPSAADQLIALGRERFDFYVDLLGAPYAVSKDDPSVRRPFGGRTNTFRSAMAHLANEVKGQMPPAAALTAALNVLDEDARKAGLDPADRIADEAGVDLPAGLEEKKSAATRLVELAESRYQFGCGLDGETFAIPLDGPKVVRTLRGGRHSLRAELADLFYQRTGSAASQSALADAAAVLEGKAQQTAPAELHLRVGQLDDRRLVLDLGDPTGQVVVISPDGWSVVTESPLRFKRTALTGALPMPARDGNLAALWPHLNLSERYRPLLVSALVSALFPSIPHPALLFTGEQGTGKSTCTGRAASVLDPSPAQLRKAPRDADSAVIAAAGSWMPALDNLSAMPDWLSDSICRWCTGDGDVRRKLYTDGDLHVISFRRAPLLNGIDVGALRGDLADRTVHLVLERIPDSARRDDAEMASEWRRDHPLVLGAILDLAVKVLGTLPDVDLAERPRMADFAKIVAAVDQHLGTEGLKAYLNLRDELAEDAATSEPLLVAMAQRVTTKFEGTSSELLELVEPSGEERASWKAPKDWPASARALTGQLRRHAPTLRRLNWVVVELDRESSRARQLRWQVKPPGDPSSGANDAADAADAAIELSSQVSDGAPGAANGAATVRQTDSDAAGAANGASVDRDAASIAAGPPAPLSSANEDHAANAASAAAIAPLLGSDDVRAHTVACAVCSQALPACGEPGDACSSCYLGGRVS